MTQNVFIPFNRSYVGSNERVYVLDAINSHSLSGDGPYSSKCQDLISNQIESVSCLLTPSATASLELAALLSKVGPGDEVIMPSFTFVSTANAFALRGATPVFIDIRSDTLNIDENLIEGAISKKTRAIVPVHYAGVSCSMDPIMEIARQNGLLVIEDAAQGLLSKYKNKSLGGIGDMGAISFHATKNISCGEGGAFITKIPEFIHQAEILREKGTNRSQFLRGEVDKYTWVEVGSSYLPSELNAAYLLAQLESAKKITDLRMNLWKSYYEALKPLEGIGYTLPTIPRECQHNAHIFYLLAPTMQVRNLLLNRLKNSNIGATFHYQPLHLTNNNDIKFKKASNLKVTESSAERIIRLPIWPGIDVFLNYIIDTIKKEAYNLDNK
jgi:dTDP-4-amino-4,6-dideoxygalactose transaminase